MDAPNLHFNRNEEPATEPTTKDIIHSGLTFLNKSGSCSSIGCAFFFALFGLAFYAGMQAKEDAKFAEQKTVEILDTTSKRIQIRINQRKKWRDATYELQMLIEENGDKRMRERAVQIIEDAEQFDKQFGDPVAETNN